MKSTIIKQIKWIGYFANFILIFYLIYNTHYGWNKTPIDETEAMLDNITILLIWVLVGFFMSIVMDFMRLVVQFIIHQTKINEK